MNIEDDPFFVAFICVALTVFCVWLLSVTT